MILKSLPLIISLFAAVGCSSVSLGGRKLASTEIPECTPKCPSGQVCVNSFTPTGAQCQAVPAEAPNLDFILPFDSKTVAICTHSSGSGSHSASNAFYAFDLATDYSKPAAVVRAAADGVAYVFGADPHGLPCSSDPKVECQLCSEPSGTAANANSSDCGQSWGNHIRILHSNGYISFYVHLDRPLVTSGTFVHRGDAIGTEGWTGAAGHRHVHWSIQAPNGSSASEWVDHISWAGQSVPFKFKAKQKNIIQTFHAADIKCSHAEIGQAPADEQPQFSGVQ